MLQNITKPTLLVDIQKCKANIAKMAQKAQKSKVIFRPHFKTHQSNEIGELFREFGVTKITVSSVDMAKFFAQNGWNDITIAFPVNILELEEINLLAKNIQLNLLVEAVEVAEILGKKMKHKVGIFIKIDTGYGRTGIDFRKTNKIDRLLTTIKPYSQLEWKGFLAHAGHSYKIRNDRTAIQKIYDECRDALQFLKQKYQPEYPQIIVSAGDTPTCSIVEKFEGLDEIRPGNFVYYDLTQWQIGSCDLDEIAVAMACPVVAKHADRNEIIVYGGGVHLSKDRLQLLNGQTVWGYATQLKTNEWTNINRNTFVKSLSQEHGIVQTNTSFFDKIKIGDILAILPVHSCMAANLLKIKAL
ncbi:MAG: alanine racemase [Chitinophagales bacterium]